MALLPGPRRAPRAGGAPRQLIVLLHGVGADGQDLIELAPALAAGLPGVAFVAPDALLFGVQAVAPLIDAFLDAELERHGLADHQLALVGFSQGAIAALYLAPRRPRGPAAVLGYSGALIGGERLPQEATSRPPVFLVHGDAGEIVPVQAMYAAVAGLQAAGIPVQWSLRRRLPHGIDPEGVAHGAASLAAAFAESGA